jgi:uncharacterized protein with ACT and thioredoxin-like domain
MSETHTEAQLLEARLQAIENDYDEGVIDGKRYQVASDKVREQLVEVYGKQAAIVGGNALAEVMGSSAPAESFTNATLGVRRVIIDSLVTVSLLHTKRGKKGFDPDSVVIEWKG